MDVKTACRYHRAMSEPRPHIDIRLVEPADLPAITIIRTSVRENHLSVAEMTARGITEAGIAAEMAGGNLRGWVALVGGVPAAFSYARRAEGTIFAMFVQPGFEGLGLGRRLMAAAEDWLFEEGVKEIWLTTDENPAIRAHGFYQRLGWVTDRTVDAGEVTYWKRRAP